MLSRLPHFGAAEYFPNFCKMCLASRGSRNQRSRCHCSDWCEAWSGTWSSRATFSASLQKYFVGKNKFQSSSSSPRSYYVLFFYFPFFILHAYIFAIYNFLIFFEKYKIYLISRLSTQYIIFYQICKMEKYKKRKCKCG